MAKFMCRNAIEWKLTDRLTVGGIARDQTAWCIYICTNIYIQLGLYKLFTPQFMEKSTIRNC